MITSAPETTSPPAHTGVVRITHWINAAATIALIVSGAAILLAHPRLYWGEVGTVDTPALLDLPIPFVFGHSGWGRYLHFFAAWAGVLSGLFYLIHAAVRRRTGREYHAVQRVTYGLVVLLLGPLVLLSGLAFSPALAARMPLLVTIFGGQQSARTVHFFAAAAVVLFLIAHIVMVAASGFQRQMRAMITGNA